MSEQKSFLSELQSRHVVRAAVLHVVIFWLLIQVADVIFPYLGIVENPVRWAIITGVALFPVTLIVAWFVEHPWHNFTSSRVAIDILVIAAIAVGAGTWVWKNLPQTIYTRTSLVVLPFHFDEGSAEGQTISRALAYEINSLLSKSKSVDVIGLESSISTLLNGLDVIAVASRLDVKHVLAGTIVAGGDSFTVQAQLYDSDGDQLWGDEIRNDIGNLYQAQEQLAESVMGQLGGQEGRKAVKKAVAESCQLPTDPDLLDRYYTARHLFELRTSSDEGVAALEESIALYESVIDESPDFAEAHSGLAWAYIVYPSYQRVDRQEWHDKAQARAYRALELCDTLGEARIIIPNDSDHENEWINNHQNIAAAMELQPHESHNVRLYANILRETGRINEAERVARENYQANPLSAKALTILAGALQYRGDFDEAVELYAAAQELGWDGPNFAAETLEKLECIESLECRAAMIADMPYGMDQYGDDWLDVWSEPETDEDLQRKVDLSMKFLEETTFVNWFNVTACWFDHLTPVFFETWEYSKRTGEYWYWPNVFHSTCGNVWTSPEFPAFAEEVGLAEYWREIGWPDMCEADGDGFVCREALAAPE